VGRQRDHNEDALFSLTTTIASNGDTTQFGLYIVADGMGGHQHGEVASETAARAMSEYIIHKLFTNLISIDPQPPEDPLREILQTGVQKAHEAIIETVTGGGTTLTGVVVLGKQMTIAHVGDSRIYSVNLNGQMKALTRDHSLVRRLEELGQLTPEEAAVHPQRNVLYRALGQGEPFEPELISAPLPRPGYLLICSDGLWGVISEIEMGEIIKSSPNLPTACKELVDAANKAGGPDNITAILVRLPE
jgi:serine/threonine protein phosphatase PrpC